MFHAGMFLEEIPTAPQILAKKDADKSFHLLTLWSRLVRDFFITSKTEYIMVQSWFEVKVTYERAGEKGLNTKVNEVYLVQGFTFTEIEKRITQELQPQVTGEFNITKMERTKYNELVDSLSETADKWFKCKISMVTIDEVSAKEKKSSVVILVKGEDVTTAVKNLNKHMEDSIMDYNLVSVNESAIVDIFHYEA
jgi:hypothetical protein